MKKYFLYCIILFAIGNFCFYHGFMKNFKKHVLYDKLFSTDFGATDDEKKLYIILGIDYIPYDLVELFESITGIKVVVDIFDSNEILEAKLLAGGVNYDIVFPTAWPHFSRQLKADIYQPIDKSKIDLKIFDDYLLKKLSIYDKDNNHALPYQWGVSGIGINSQIINNCLKNQSLDTFSIIFDEKNAKILSKYKISVYESPDELFPAIMAYLGLNPESENEQDTIKAAQHLKKIRKCINKFTSYGFEDLASKNACIALSTSGDIVQVSTKNNDSNIKFIYPKEGASLWIDVVAIPKTAKHINNAYVFLKFIFHPEVIAYVTNNTSRANAVKAANKHIFPYLINDKSIYPSDEMKKKCYIEIPIPPKIGELRTRLFTKIKSMNCNEDENVECTF